MRKKYYYEEDKPKKEKKIKAKWIVLTVIILVVSIVVAAVILLNNKDEESPVIIENNTTLRNVNGKLANYITGLGDNYYIRYTGEFGKKSLNENLVEATVEFTRNKGHIAIYSEKLYMHIVTDNDYAYNVMHSYKGVLKVKLPSVFSTESYNLISDFGQVYVADVKVKVAGVDYIYQEYKWQDSKIRYYFVDDDLRHIRIVHGDTDRKINIRVDRHTKYDLFEIPETYKFMN